MESPFSFGKLVTHEQNNFTDREEERKRLVSNARSGVNTILISPRRWGKSSLMRTVAQDMAGKHKVVFCFIDLFRINSQEEFLAMLATEIMRSTSTKTEDLITGMKTFFKELTPKLSFSVDPEHDIRIGFDLQQVKENPNEVLDLAQKIAEKKGVRIVICIDEFQNLSSFDNKDVFQKKLRSAWQLQPNVTYFLYGSKRHMMNDIFHSSQRPFYRFGDVINLPKIPREDLVKFIVSSFKRTKKSIGKKLADQIVSHMDRHPYYVQQLSHLVWVRSRPKATEETVEASLEDLLSQNSMFYEREVEMMSRTQTNFLKALSDGHQQFSAKQVLYDYDIGTSSNVVKIKSALIDKEIIDILEGQVSFLDPAFELWFRKRMF